MPRVTFIRNYTPLSEEEQLKRRPLPVGVLLNGIVGPMELNETARRIKLRRVKCQE